MRLINCSYLQTLSLVLNRITGDPIGQIGPTISPVLYKNTKARKSSTVRNTGPDRRRGGACRCKAHEPSALYLGMQPVQLVCQPGQRPRRPLVGGNNWRRLSKKDNRVTCGVCAMVSLGDWSYCVSVRLVPVCRWKTGLL